ncbi:putative Dynein heavy chain [Giardia muris]|uniref:Putative Dynein heavy chain n=1 Tax=Giardia muris TaxID=5742 RepID=A0A4Z1SQZ1_GIAMU|nr:putative Dynein heavy chain [Giardia muris]|eukprot:TNJ28292.1 putative Dynein heavy chain [Giardia muris]
MLYKALNRSHKEDDVILLKDEPEGPITDNPQGLYGKPCTTHHCNPCDSRCFSSLLINLNNGFLEHVGDVHLDAQGPDRSAGSEHRRGSAALEMTGETMGGLNLEAWEFKNHIVVSVPVDTAQVLVTQRGEERLPPALLGKNDPRRDSRVLVLETDELGRAGLYIIELSLRRHHLNLLFAIETVEGSIMGSVFIELNVPLRLEVYRRDEESVNAVDAIKYMGDEAVGLVCAPLIDLRGRAQLLRNDVEVLLQSRTVISSGMTGACVDVRPHRYRRVLERLYELLDNQVINLINKQVNPEFRIFLTTEPTDNFPLSIVSNSIKITTEPPSSLRLNMMQTFSKVTEEQLMECPSPYFRPLVYTLAFFHATIQERQKFGKLGWNVKYDFNASDFVISFELLKTFLTKAFLAGKEIPWSSLKYLIGLCMYGGRVSDNFDRRVLSTYMDEYLGDFLFDTHNPFSYYGKKEGNDFNYAPPPVVTSASGGNQVVVLTELVTKLIKYSIAENGTQGLPGWTPQMSATNEAQVTDYINTVLKEMTTVKECYETFYISRIPLLTSPQIFGLHTNAEISYLETAAREMCVCLAELQPRSSSGETVSKEDFLIDLCKILEGRVPPQFDLPQIRKKFKSLSPTDIVLLQEIERFNILVKVISSSVAELQKALSGEIGMSEQLDSIATSFFIGQIPHNWLRFAPQTLKMLSSWIQHLLRRAEQYKVWHTQGEPAVMWLSGLHIPESYLTALVQITSRAKRWPLDKSALFTTVTKYIQAEDVSEKLEFGCYISGLFLEGAAWDTTKDCLTYSKKKELITQLPLVQIVPAEASRIKLRNQFKAPVYVTTARTNAAGQGLVFSADLSSYEHDSLWILQGVAVILNDN